MFMIKLGIRLDKKEAMPKSYEILIRFVLLFPKPT